MLWHFIDFTVIVAQFVDFRFLYEQIISEQIPDSTDTESSHFEFSMIVSYVVNVHRGSFVYFALRARELSIAIGSVTTYVAKYMKWCFFRRRSNERNDCFCANFASFIYRQQIYNSRDIQVQLHPTVKVKATRMYRTQRKITSLEYIDLA